MVLEVLRRSENVNTDRSTRPILGLDASVIGQFIRFSIVGFLGLFADLGALWFALNIIGLNPFLSRIFSFLCAATFTWICNRTFTFNARGRGGLLRQWAKFLSVNALGGVANFLVYALVMVKFGKALWLPDVARELLPYIGVTVGAVVGLAINFTASRKLIFN